MMPHLRRPCCCWPAAHCLLASLLLAALLRPSAQQQSGGVSGGSSSSAEVVVVSSGDELLAALNDTSTQTILLEGNVTLTAAAADAYSPPFYLGANKSLSIESGDGTTRLLDLGGILHLLYMEPGSTLHMRGLAVQGLAGAGAGLAADIRTQVNGSPFWPTIDGGDNTTVVFEGGTILYPTANCDPERVQYQAADWQRDVGQTGSVTASGLTIGVDGTVILVPHIADIVTKDHKGEAEYMFTNFTITCYEDRPPGSGTPGSGAGAGVSGGGGGSHAWVWAAIGCAVGVAALVAAAAVLLLYRRRQRVRQHHLAEEGPAAAWPRADSQGISSAGGSGEAAGFSRADPAVVVMEAGSSHASEGVEGWLGRPLEEPAADLGAAIYHTRVGAIEGLTLGELLGRGSFGRCYRGRWKGAVVAVKIIDHCIQPGKECDLSREPLLSMSVSHPNCVMTYKLSVVCVRAAPSSVQDTARQDSLDASDGPALTAASSEALPGAAAAAAGDVRLSGPRRAGSAPSALPPLPEKGSGGSGDRGSSGGRRGSGPGRGSGGQRASGGGGTPAGSGEPGRQVPGISAGSGGGGGGAGMVEVVSPQTVLPPGLYETWLCMEYCDRGSLTDAILTGRFVHPATKELDVVAVLLTLLDVSQGLDYLHNSVSMVHGDLKGRNVLLKTARNDRRGFVAKLADFGLSRMMGQETHVNTKSYGTATHASPELLTDGMLTFAADIYALAIIMWEMVSGEEAYETLGALQIIVQVTQFNYRLDIPPACPGPLASLITRCWSKDPADRPTIEEVVQELRSMLAECRRSLDRTRSEAAAAAAANK